GGAGYVGWGWKASSCPGGGDSGRSPIVPRSVGPTGKPGSVGSAGAPGSVGTAGGAGSVAGGGIAGSVDSVGVGDGVSGSNGVNGSAVGSAYGEVVTPPVYTTPIAPATAHAATITPMMIS